MSRLGPGDVMEFDADGEPSDDERDEVYYRRHPSCEECGGRCCFCPLACDGGDAVEIDEGVYVHTGNCQRALEEDRERGPEDTTPSEENT